MPNGDESILLVEDDPGVRHLATLVLRERGYRVQESASAVEALELISPEAPFDLVITDVVMPKMSGQELCQHVRRRVPETRLLLMSGHTDDALIHHGVLNDGWAFLEKPFSPARFARKVREVLDASA
jgi:CheY-like chemotaxis protein